MGRLAGLANGHAGRVLAVAGVVFLAAAVLGLPVAGTFKSTSRDFQDSGSQYERANAAIQRATGQSPYYGLVVLLRGRAELRRGPAAQRATTYLAGLLSHQRGFQRLLDYPTSHLPELVSRSGRMAMMLAAFARPQETAAAVAAARKALSRPSGRAVLQGLNVRFGGSDLAFEELNRGTIAGLQRAELIAFPVVLGLSFLFFGGLVAALLPPLVGGMAIVLTFMLLRALDQLTPISIFSLNLVTGLGLGLGIDYSLFVLARYREELAGGATPATAVVATMRTAGRTVLYSSLTVAAALTALLVFPTRFLSSMGYGGALAALADGAVALIVLPALLIALGPRINALSPMWLRRSAARSSLPSQHGAWSRLARLVMRRPGAIALATAAILVVAAAPALGLRLVAPGANLLPRSAESHEVERALASEFAIDPAEAAVVVLRAPAAAAARLSAAASAAAGASARTLAPRYLGRGTWEIDLLPRGSPVSAVQQRLVRRLRSLARPYRALVGGWTAYFMDQKSSLDSHIPIALLILLVVTGTFLFLMTGSVLLPAKGFLMSLLTTAIGAGLVVEIFQRGHFSALLGFTPIGGLEESSLLLMFVIAFALSTDYEVFVLGRIKEAREHGLPNREAIAVGIERTGRLVTAAALLFCVAVGALTTSPLFFTKQFGLGTALAVVIDASIIRALLVPSLMALMGEWNWWAPRPLRRLHDRLGLVEHGADGTERSAALAGPALDALRRGPPPRPGGP